MRYNILNLPRVFGSNIHVLSFCILLFSSQERSHTGYTDVCVLVCVSVLFLEDW